MTISRAMPAVAAFLVLSAGTAAGAQDGATGETTHPDIAVVASSVGFDFGNYLDTKANEKLRAYAMVPETQKATLEGMGYSTASATAGVGMKYENLAVYARAGLSYVGFDSRPGASAARGASEHMGSGASHLTPAVKVGLAWYFF